MKPEPAVPVPSSNSVAPLLASELELQLEALRNSGLERPRLGVAIAHQPDPLFECLRHELALLESILFRLP
jgi:hypothetical protein